MAKASKPVALMKKNLTKEEKARREEQETKLKGNDNLVYNVPPCLYSQEEQDTYAFLVEELKASKILNNLDIELLITCTDSIINMRKARDLIKRQGLVVVKENGTPVRNPATTIYKDYNAIYNKCCMELGLSPSARSKLSFINANAEREKADPLLNALKGEY